MSLWGNLGTANKPKYYGNTADVVSVNVATEQANHSIPHAGWVVERAETAGLVLTITAAGTGYLVGDALTFTGGNTLPGAIPASGKVTQVSNTGGITGVTLSSDGEYTTTTAPTVGVQTVAGNNAVITASISGGRIGRTFVEVLVAGSFDDTTFGVG